MHGLSSTPWNTEWQKIVEKYGKAETAEQHEKIVSEAIKKVLWRKVNKDV